MGDAKLALIYQKMLEGVATQDELSYFKERQRELQRVNGEAILSKMPAWEQWLHRNMENAIQSWSQAGFDSDDSAYSKSQLLFVFQFYAKVWIDNDGLGTFFGIELGMTGLEVGEGFGMLGYDRSSKAMANACEVFGPDFPRELPNRLNILSESPDFSKFEKEIYAEFKSKGRQEYKNRCSDFFATGFSSSDE